MKIYLLSFLVFIMAALLLVSHAQGNACSVGGCSGEESWTASAQSFLSSDAPIVGVTQNQNKLPNSFQAGMTASGRANTTQNSTVPSIGREYIPTESRTKLFLAPQLLKPMDSIPEEYVVLDVSNKRSVGEARIRGAIGIPSMRFLYENGSMRSAPELVAILGQAGISDKDAVLVYSDNFNSGEAAFVLWMLCYLGHKDVQTLDGGLEDWIAASLPLETKENVRPAFSYSPHQRPELLSNYDFIKSGNAQMVDARTFQDFGKSKIPNAIFISPESILEGGRIKEGAKLNDTFARLDVSRPVAVYSNDLLNSSLVWFAMQLMGFDSRIYEWQDWQAREFAKVF